MATIKKMILEALEKKYNAEIAEADATIKVYLENPVGIGEHPDIMAAIDSEINSIAQAHEKIEIINHYFLGR